MVSKLEILSDEVLVEIIGYLDAYQLFKGFYNLNSRFNRLLNDDLLYLKLNSKYIRRLDVTNEELFRTMAKHLTAITLINDVHIRIVMLLFRTDDFMNIQLLTLLRVRIDKENGSVARYISHLKSIKNLRVQAIGSITSLISEIFYFDQLIELKSFECTSSRTDIILPGGQKTNIESLTVKCILCSLYDMFLKTPKLKYLTVDLASSRPNGPVLLQSPLPLMMYLTHLKMKIHFLSYDHLKDIINSMPHLENFELSGSSSGPNMDNGHELKKLFGYIPEVQLDNLECPTTATSTDTILATFRDVIDRFWWDVTCSIRYNKAYISAFGDKE